MDTAAKTGSVDVSEVRSEGLEATVGEKRPAENGDDGEFVVPSPKKARNGGILVGSVKKVAEIALVLAALGKVRAGRSPTAAEKEMMVEAREKLAKVCEGFAPKDVFPRDAFGTVIEDLGLNKLKEQKLGFRPPKMSIAEKLLFSKQKMEKSQEFSLHSAAPSSQQSQTNLGIPAEGRSPMTTTRTFPSDKPIHAAVSLGGFQYAKSTASPYQLPASEVRTSVVSGELPTSLLGKDSPSSVLPRAERPHLRSDPRLNGTSYILQVQASTPGGQTMPKPSNWSQQSRSASSDKTGPDSKLLPQPFPKVDGAIKLHGNASLDSSRVTPQSTASKPLTTQVTSSHLPVMRENEHGIQIVQPPSLSNVHIEIGKIVQKLLQPQIPGHPTWTPPSRDYMNKAVTCQVCKLTINEVENVLVCDACETGYHLKCLQFYNQKAIPRGEWHCFKCLSLSNGKPLPPKYGRVTRNMSTPKVLSNSTAAHPSAEKKEGALGGMVNQQNVTANGSTCIQSSTTDGISHDHNHLSSAANMPNAREMQADNILSSREERDDKHHFETHSNFAIRPSDPDCIASAASLSFERSIEKRQISELNGQPYAEPLKKTDKMSNHSQALSNSHDTDQKGLTSGDGIPLSQLHDNIKVKDSEKYNGGETFDRMLNHNIKQNLQGVAQVRKTVTTNSQTKVNDKFSSDDSLDVTWIGSILEVVDDNNYYQSCCINGTLYRLHQYALFRSEKGKLMPSKLQAMWEDKKTGSKWVKVNLCYFPDELPETVGRPCSRECNEVYESNHGTKIMASLLRGPCDVLPPGKFNEENGRRSCLGTGTVDGLQPIFVCKWFFDEKKGVFRDVLS